MKPDATRTVYEGRLLSVVLERWGEHEREIVEHPGSVAVVAVDDEGYVTLVRQLREPARERVLELPAGVIEDGEAPLETARRELEEETGLRGGDWREPARVWTSPGFLRESITFPDTQVGPRDQRWMPALIRTRLTGVRFPPGRARPSPKGMCQVQAECMVAPLS